MTLYQLLQYNPEYDVVISLDRSAMLEYWGGVSHDYKFPNNVKFQYKTDTDLYEFAKVTIAMLKYVHMYNHAYRTTITTWVLNVLGICCMHTKA